MYDGFYIDLFMLVAFIATCIWIYKTKKAKK